MGISTIVEFLHKKGVKIDSNPNEKITSEQCDMLLKEFSTDFNVKKESEKLNLRNKREKLETVVLGEVHQEKESELQEYEEEVLVKNVRVTGLHAEPEVERPVEREQIKLNVLGKIDIDKLSPPKKAPVQKEVPPEPVKPPEPPVIPEPEVTVPEPEEIKPVAEPEVVVPPVVETPVEEIPRKQEEIFLKQDYKDVEVKVVGKIDLDSMNQRTRRGLGASGVS